MSKVLDSIKLSFLKNQKLSKILGWRGLYGFVMHSTTKFKYIAYMYLLTHRNRKLRDRILEELKSQPWCEKAIRERLWINRTLDELKHCPEGSLGKAVYQHMHDNNIKFVVEPKENVKNDFQYIIRRLLITHDIYHPLLDAPTNYYGEAVVAAFTSAQINAYTPAAVHMGAGILRCAIVEHNVLDTSELGIVTGWLLGKTAKQLFCVDWDQLWDTPIEKVRADLNINIKEMNTLLEKMCNKQQNLTRILDNLPTTLNECLNKHVCDKKVYTISGQDREESYKLKTFCFTPIEKPIIATAILGRAMFTTGQYLRKIHEPSLAACLSQEGIQVFVPEIGMRNNHHVQHHRHIHDSFDTMLEDVNRAIELVKSIDPDKPVFLIGHSLSGMCFLVQQALAGNSHRVNGIVTLGTAPWNHDTLKKEEKLSYLFKLQAIAKYLEFISRMKDPFPSRFLKYGNHDECFTMIKQVILNNIQKGSFTSLDQEIDYYTSLDKVTCPVLSIASNDDEFAHVSQVKSFHRNLQKEPNYIIVDHLGHMALANSSKSWEMWKKIASWIKNAA